MQPAATAGIVRSIDKPYALLLTVFVAVMAILNVISGKLSDLPIWFAPVGAGILCYWITFPITDVVSEVYGKKNAQFLVWMGFLTNLIVLGLANWAIVLTPADSYPHQEAFATTLGAVGLIVLASLTAYLAAQTHDVWAYHFWKRITGGRHMWLRNNLSTISSQLIDSLIFNGIAFYYPGVFKSFGEYLQTTLAYWLLKLCIALVDTPLVYALHRWLTGHWSPASRPAPEIAPA
ncbi:MAG: queuosine precursor transporter [Opitutales bacterium]